jgi:hypothetical protein
MDKGNIWVLILSFLIGALGSALMFFVIYKLGAWGWLLLPVVLVIVLALILVAGYIIWWIDDKHLSRR